MGTEEERAAYAVECERHGITVDELAALVRMRAGHGAAKTSTPR